MYIKTTYAQEFDDFWMYLKSKYPKKLFDLDGLGEQMDMSKFSKNFFGNKVVADSSVDANSNVADNSMISYDKELPKPFLKMNSYYMVWKGLRKSYGKLKANEIIEKIIGGDLYINDAVQVSKPYCFNYDPYDIIAQGLPMVNKIHSGPPKYLYAFKSQVEQFTVIAANSSLGATGYATLLIMMSYYVKNILNTKSDAHFHFATEEDCWSYVKENLISLIYTLNQPMRSTDSPFTNISVYDDYFLEEMREDYLFPDGSYFDINIVHKLQEMFLDIMNEELERTPITFPITTACFSVDEEGNIKDKKFLKMISEKNLKYAFINIYCGDSSTLSSCCFNGEQEIFVKTSNVKKYTFKELFSLSSKKVNTYYKGKWIEGEVVRLPSRKMYKITTIDNKEIIITDNHINPTLKGDKETVNLTINDYLLLDNSLLVDTNNYNYYKDEKGNVYIKIKTIEQIKYDEPYVYCLKMKNEDEPYFTLPNGIITHNCRLRSNKDAFDLGYTNSFGSGGAKIGSLGVATINLPRLAIKSKNEEDFIEKLKEEVKNAQRINHVKRNLLKKRIEGGFLPLYSFNFMDINKQYSTCGIIGFSNCINYLGKNILEPEGIELGLRIIDTINEVNDELTRRDKEPRNCENIPGEQVAIKLPLKDQLLGYQNDCDLYANQFIDLREKTSLFNRIKLQGIFDKHFSGGCILHVNVEDKMNSTKDMANMIEYCAKKGVVYFAINYVLLECKNHHMTVGKDKVCSICGKPIINSYTRVVGFLTNTSDWHKVRRNLDFPERKFYSGISNIEEVSH